MHLGEEKRNRRKTGAIDGGNAVLGEKLPEHRGVLVGHRSAELRQHAGRQTESGGDGIEMPGARAGAGPDQQRVDLAGGDDLVHERVNGGPAAVDDALPADLDDARIRQYPEVGGRSGCFGQLRVGQRSLHEERFELRRRAVHTDSFRRVHSLSRHGGRATDGA
ncbi:MAG: hypothetical protein QM739_17320 [Propionivibrio sp.]